MHREHVSAGGASAKSHALDRRTRLGLRSGFLLSCGFSALLALAAPGEAAAQTVGAQTPPADETDRSEGATTVQEVVVTAGRREQSLQDVPVSVAVVSGETIKELAITNLDELSQYVPGLTITEGGEQTGISIRGFGASLNFGIDQSVGLFLDEIYAGRERQFRGTFLDVERVEVLKGPQGTLFGKNTIAGAITITSGTPTQDPSASFRAEYGPVTGRRAIEAVLNGPITSTLSGRAAFRLSKEDGYMFNTLTGEDEEQEEDKVGRLSLLWRPTDQLSVRGKVEYSEYDRIGRNFQISEISGFAVGRPLITNPATLQPRPVPIDVGAAQNLNTYRFYDPKFDFGFDRTNSKQRESAHVVAKGATLNAAYDFGPVVFRSITGYSAYESEDQRDVDWSPTPFLFEPISQEFSQISQEFRLVSDIGERFDYITGLYYFKTDFFVDRRTDIDINLFFVPISALPTRRYANLRFLDQTAETYAAYFQGTYHLTPNIDITAGLRYSTETKTATDRLDFAEFGTDRFLDLNDPADAALLAVARMFNAGLATARHSFSGENTEDNLLPEVRVSWDINDDAMVYASATKGYKGGGFNSNSATQNEEDDFVFRPETVVAFEVGSKLRLLDRSMNLNLAAFRQDFTDLQLSVFTGAGFFLTNAGSARSQGLEADLRWRVSERLNLNGAISLVDATYTESVLAACNVGQLNFGQPGCFRTAQGRNVQDFEGKRFAPKYTASLGVGYIQPLGGDLEVLLRADANFRAQGQFALDPTITQPPLQTLDLGATLRSASAGYDWSFGVLVQNALDEEYYFFEFEAPAQTGTRIGFPAPPRRVVFKLTLDY